MSQQLVLGDDGAIARRLRNYEPRPQQLEMADAVADAIAQRKHLMVTGSSLRSRTVAEKAAIVAALREKVWPLWAAGRLRPFTYKQFPLVQAEDAHRLMESSQHIGKILLVA